MMSCEHHLAGFSPLVNRSNQRDKLIMTSIETIGQSGPVSSCCSLGDSGDKSYWVLKLPRVYPKPKYQIGQIVLYNDYTAEPEADYIVRINGLNWTGVEWEYAIQLPVNHPMWQSCINENQYFLTEDQITTI